MACDAAYPVQAGIPWLFRDVASARAQWAAKLQQFRTEVLAEREQLASAREEEGLVDSTRVRLERAYEGLERLAEQVFGLLEPFALGSADAPSSLASDRIPSRQHVTSYLETCFRDWCWGEEEVCATKALVEPLIGELSRGSQTLVVGGGAGRFAWELARMRPETCVVQLDVNPILTRIGAMVVSGDRVELTELPRMPQSVDDVAVDQVLARPTEADSETVMAPLFVLGDGIRPPIAADSVDLLVTPWFVDIVPEAFPNLVRRIGSLLAEGGDWLSFGPTSFEAQGPSNRFTPEEMVDILEREGFRIEEAGLEDVAYLHSPHGMPRRGERIFVFKAKRIGMVAEPEEHSFYPAWMTDPRLAIPAETRFETLRAERTFDLEILKCIDGRAAIEDIVVILASRYGLERDRCRNTVNRFFARLVEGGGEE